MVSDDEISHAMRVLVLVSGDSSEDAGRAKTAGQQLESMGVDVVGARAERLDDWPDLIDSHADRIDCLVVGGGDGSLNFAIDAIMRHDLTLGVLPLGTANDFARTLGCPGDLEGACRIVAQGVDHRVDVGQVNDVRFLNVASIGFAVHASRYRSDKAKRWFGALGYASNLYAAFRATRPFHARVSCDGKQQDLRSIQLAVGNGRYFGGGLAVADDAALEDGRLDLFSIQPQSAGALLRLVPALLRGPDRTTQGTQVMRGTHIRIDTRRQRSINTDGEVLTRTPAEFRVLPRALTVRVSSDYRDATRAREQGASSNSIRKPVDSNG